MWEVCAGLFHAASQDLAEARRAEVAADVDASLLHRTGLSTVIASALDGMRAVDMRALLDAYHGPRLAIAAADIESPSSLHVQFPDVPVRKIHGAGHWLMMDKPDEFNQILDEFLAGVR